MEVRYWLNGFFLHQKPSNILVMGEGPERGKVKIGRNEVYYNYGKCIIVFNWEEIHVHVHMYMYVHVHVKHNYLCVHVHVHVHVQHNYLCMYVHVHIKRLKPNYRLYFSLSLSLSSWHGVCSFIQCSPEAISWTWSSSCYLLVQSSWTSVRC